jgi:hypothetical protein
VKIKTLALLISIACCGCGKSKSTIIAEQQTQIATLENSISKLTGTLALVSFERSGWSNQCCAMNSMFQAPRNDRQKYLPSVCDVISNNLVNFMVTVRAEGAQARGRLDDIDATAKDSEIASLQVRVESLREENTDLKRKQEDSASKAFNDEMRRIRDDDLAERRILASQRQANAAAFQAEATLDAAEATQDAAWAAQRQADALDRMATDAEFNSIWKK